MAAVYESHEEAEATISDVHRSRVTLRELSSVDSRRKPDGHSLGYDEGGDHMIFWEEDSTFWDDFWRILHGSAFYFIPGFGSLLVGGPVIASILASLEMGLSGGLSKTSGGCSARMGGPGDQVKPYETAIRRGHYLVIAETDADDTSKAGEIIASTTPLFRGDYPAEILRQAPSLVGQRDTSSPIPTFFFS